MIDMFNKKTLLNNFLRCSTWEDKYFYIADLGNYLKPLPQNMRRSEYLIDDCQSKVWIVILVDLLGNIKFYGDSESVIVKGLIFIIFVFYKKLSLFNIINQNILNFFKKLSLINYLTVSRSKGIKAIIHMIEFKVINFFLKK